MKPEDLKAHVWNVISVKLPTCTSLTYCSVRWHCVLCYYVLCNCAILGLYFIVTANRIGIRGTASHCQNQLIPDTRDFVQQSDSPPHACLFPFQSFVQYARMSGKMVSTQYACILTHTHPCTYIGTCAYMYIMCHMTMHVCMCTCSWKQLPVLKFVVILTRVRYCKYIHV